jgi:hypothetical protein
MTSRLTKLAPAQPCAPRDPHALARRCPRRKWGYVVQVAGDPGSRIHVRGTHVAMSQAATRQMPRVWIHQRGKAARTTPRAVRNTRKGRMSCSS